jgi:hypothetical protein
MIDARRSFSSKIKGLPLQRRFESDSKITIEFDTGFTSSNSLSDGTLLFLTMDKYESAIVRLDDKLQQHTSVDDRVFVLDAADINAELGQSADIQDPTFRYQVFLAAIEAVKKEGLH